MAVTPDQYVPQSKDNTNLGNLLQIAFTDGIVYQNSENFSDWDMITKNKVSDRQARTQAFMLQTELGAAASQFVGQGYGLKFPKGQQTKQDEYDAKMKQISTTVEIEMDLIDRAAKSEKYVDPLAHEINSKVISQKRMLSIALHGDGTGVLGKASSSIDADLVTIAFDNAITSGTSFVNANSYGGERWCQYGDLLVTAAVDGSSANAQIYKVVEKDRESDSVVCEVYDANGAKVGSPAAVPAGEVLIYRAGQRTKADLSDDATVKAADLNSSTEAMVGFDTLYSNDGRTVHGIKMKGSTSATVHSVNGALDISTFQRAVSKVKNRVGSDKYSYKQALSSFEAIDYLIESNEADRRLVDIAKQERGATGFGYVHGSDTIKLQDSEFAKSDRMLLLPESAKQKAVCEFYGTDIYNVKAGSQDTFLARDGDGDRIGVIQKYMVGRVTLLSRHPAAALVIDKFTIGAV